MTVRDRTASGQALRFTLLLALAGVGSLWSVAAARAQAPTAGFATSYGANAGKPVDIEADTLEVNDKKKTAVFKGNVSATQGDMNLKSNEIHVIYTSGGSAAAGSKTASAGTSDAAASPLGGTGQIKEITAEGNVLVTMTGSGDKAEKQTAKSDRAHFDVVKQLITLTGNVELAKGDLRQNVMVGNKLVINITEGTSQLDNSGTDAQGKPKRIQAIFAPPAKDKDKDKTKPKEGAQ